MESFEYAVAPGWWYQLRPLTYGYEACSPGHSFGPYVRHHFLLHYVLKGSGTFQKNGVMHSVNGGDLFVILPEDLTTYRADTERPWEYIWLGFLANEIPDFLKVPVIRQPPVRDLFEEIRDQGQFEKSDGKIFSLMYDILWQLSRDTSVPENRQNTYALYTKTYLDTTYMRQVSIQEIANSLHIDRRYLTALFRKNYGLSPQAYLMQLRLEQAREFLNQGYAVAEAALMSGFTDLANFSRKYKQVFGICPSRQQERPG